MAWQNDVIATEHWSRAIILVDMNAFFASVEQHDFPELRGRPVVITNGNEGTTIITCSYEARAYGIKTGMKIKEAKQLCPHLVQLPTRPKRYAAVSEKIMSALIAITPDIEIYSVDEAFLDVTHCQTLHGSAEKIGLLTKKCVYEASGLLCSIGISGDKTTAKYAANFKKPNGFHVIPPWSAKQALKEVPVTELWGIARGIGNFLAKHGVYTCGDIEKLPISILAQRFGNLGRRIWYMCQGNDPEAVHTEIPHPKSMGHGKVLPPGTVASTVIETYFLHMCEKLAARLRQHQFKAQRFFVGFKDWHFGWSGTKVKLMQPVDDAQLIFQQALQMLNQHWSGHAIAQVQVTALDPRRTEFQLDFFQMVDDKKTKINAVTDLINKKFGEFTLAPAPLLNRTTAPNVIAPAWKPNGHRQTI